MNFQDHLCSFSVSFQDCLIEWISSKSDFRIILNNTVHNYTKQQIELSPTVDNDNVCKGRHGSQMRHDFPRLSRI